MTWTDLYPRHAARPLAEALAHSPAVLVHGPRQCGKTTLARSGGGPLGHSYVSFDDDVARRTAETDPAGVGFALDPLHLQDEHDAGSQADQEVGAARNSMTVDSGLQRREEPGDTLHFVQHDPLGQVGHDPVKRTFMEEWCRAVTAHGGFGQWRQAVSWRPGEVHGILAENLKPK